MINERFDLQFRVELEAILVFHEQTMVGQLRQLEGKSFDFDQERLYQYSKDYLRKHIRPQVREYMSQPAYREYGRPHYTGWGITVVAGHHDNPRGEHVRYSRIGRIRTYAVEHLELARKLLRSPAPNHNNPGDFGNLFPDALEIDLYDGNTSPTHYKKWHLINDFSLVGLYKENLRAYLERHKVCEDYPRTRDITMNQPTFILPTKTPLTRTVWKNDDLPISSYPSTSGSYKTPSRGPEFSPITPDEMSGQNPSTGNHSFPSLLVPFETPPREYNGSEEPKSSPSIIWVTDIEERGEGLEGSSNNPIVISGETTEIEDPDATESAADDGVTETKVGDTGSASSKRSKVSGSKRKAGNNFRYKTPKRLKSSDLVTGVDDYNVANIMGELGLAQLNPALAGIAIEAESVSSNQATAGSTVTQSRVLSTTQGAGVEQPLSKKDKGKRKANDQGEVEYVKKIKLFEPIGPRRIDEGEWDTHGIELVSNVLRPVEESFNTIDELCRRLKGGCCDLLGATTNQFCGFNVHVQPARSHFDLKTLQHLASILVIFEEPLDKLFPIWRRVSIDNFLSEREFRSNKGRWKYEPGDPKAKYKYWQYDEAGGEIEEIDGEHSFQNPMDIACDIFKTGSIQGLQEVITGGKEQVVSFDNVGLHAGAKVPQTIEFRQHEGVTDGQMVKWWVMFCIGLVRLAEQRAQESAGSDKEPYIQAQRYHDWNDNISVWDLFDMMDFPAEGVQYFERKAAYHADPTGQLDAWAVQFSQKGVDHGRNGGEDKENTHTVVDTFLGDQPVGGGHGEGSNGSPKGSGERVRGDEEKTTREDDGEKSPTNSLDPTPSQSPDPPPSQSSYGSGGPVNTPSPGRDDQKPDEGDEKSPTNSLDPTPSQSPDPPPSQSSYGSGGPDNTPSPGPDDHNPDKGDDDDSDSDDDDDDNDHPDEIPLPAPQINPVTGEPVGGHFNILTTSSFVSNDGKVRSDDIPLPAPQIYPVIGEPVGGNFNILTTSSSVSNGGDDRPGDIPLPAPQINPVTGEPVGGHFNILTTSSFASHEGVEEPSPHPGVLACSTAGLRDSLHGLLPPSKSITSGSFSGSSKENNQPSQDHPSESITKSSPPDQGTSTRISYLPTPSSEDPTPPAAEGHDEPAIKEEEEDDDDVIPSIEVDDNILVKTEDDDDDDWLPAIEEEDEDDDDDDDDDTVEETDEDEKLSTTGQHPDSGAGGGADPVTPTREAGTDLPDHGATLDNQALNALTLSAARRKKRKQMGLRVSFAASILTRSSSEIGSMGAETERFSGEEESGGVAEQASMQLLGNLQEAAEDGNGEENAQGLERIHGGSGVGGTEEDWALGDSLFGSDSEHGDIEGL